MESYEQDKSVEIHVSRKGLQKVHPEDFDIQNEVKKFRLQKLKLIPLQGQFVLDAGCGLETYGFTITMLTSCYAKVNDKIINLTILD